VSCHSIYNISSTQKILPLKGLDNSDDEQENPFSKDEISSLVKKHFEGNFPLQLVAEVKAWNPLNPDKKIKQTALAVLEKSSLTHNSITLHFYPSEMMLFSYGFNGHYSTLKFKANETTTSRLFGKETQFFKAETCLETKTLKFKSLNLRATIIASPMSLDKIFQITENQGFEKTDLSISDCFKTLFIKEIQYKII